MCSQAGTRWKGGTKNVFIFQCNFLHVDWKDALINHDKDSMGMSAVQKAGRM